MRPGYYIQLELVRLLYPQLHTSVHAICPSNPDFVKKLTELARFCARELPGGVNASPAFLDERQAAVSAADAVMAAIAPSVTTPSASAVALVSNVSTSSVPASPAQASVAAPSGPAPMVSTGALTSSVASSSMSAADYERLADFLKMGRSLNLSDQLIRSIHSQVEAEHMAGPASTSAAGPAASVSSTVADSMPTLVLPQRSTSPPADVPVVPTASVSSPAGSSVSPPKSPASETEFFRYLDDSEH